jgi:HD-GYP domain-containing protein (c-di-GMP phosphodiesterase class II)
MSQPTAPLIEPEGESPHYIRAVTEVGDERPIIASQDIFAANGMKLVSKGAAINSRQFDRLSQHRLALPLDRTLSAERPMNASALALEVGKIIEQDARYRRIVSRSGDPLALKFALTNLSLPAPVLLRLTVMSERRQALFQHSLRCAMIAFSMALRARLSEPTRAVALVAALCHDFGEMHTDPAVLAAGHEITGPERRFVHVHPLTAYLLLRDLPGFAPAAAQAILQHHERLDGSGYPNGLDGERITQLARLVAVADVAEAFISRCDLGRLDVSLRLNAKRFDPQFVTLLRDLVQVTSGAATSAPDDAGTAMRLANLDGLLRAWGSLRALFAQQVAPIDTSATPLAFLFERMAVMRSLVLQAGFDPDDMAHMLSFVRDDPGMLQELGAMLDEMAWLGRDLANEIERRSDQLGGLSQSALNELIPYLRPLQPEPVEEAPAPDAGADAGADIDTDTQAL